MFIHACFSCIYTQQSSSSSPACPWVASQGRVGLGDDACLEVVDKAQLGGADVGARTACKTAKETVPSMDKHIANSLSTRKHTSQHGL
jgi:hypothetical protein